MEAALPGLIADNTYYTYQSFDPATASVTPTEGGYQYANDVSILDGEGNATVTNVLLVCDADGNVTHLLLLDESEETLTAFREGLAKTQ